MSSTDKAAKGPTINVVKPFTFTHAGSPVVRDPVSGKITAHAQPGYEKSFAVGDNQEATPEMAEHPWVLAGADGAIESDEQRDARLKAEKAAAAADVPAAASTAASQTKSSKGS